MNHRLGLPCHRSCTHRVGATRAIKVACAVVYRSICIVVAGRWIGATEATRIDPNLDHISPLSASISLLGGVQVPAAINVPSEPEIVYVPPFHPSPYVSYVQCRHPRQTMVCVQNLLTPKSPIQFQRPTDFAIPGSSTNGDGHTCARDARTIVYGGLRAVVACTGQCNRHKSCCRLPPPHSSLAKHEPSSAPWHRSCTHRDLQPPQSCCRHHTPHRRWPNEPSSTNSVVIVARSWIGATSARAVVTSTHTVVVGQAGHRLGLLSHRSCTHQGQCNPCNQVACAVLQKHLHVVAADGSVQPRPKSTPIWTTSIPELASPCWAGQMPDSLCRRRSKACIAPFQPSPYESVMVVRQPAGKQIVSVPTPDARVSIRRRGDFDFAVQDPPTVMVTPVPGMQEPSSMVASRRSYALGSVQPVHELLSPTTRRSRRLKPSHCP